VWTILTVVLLLFVAVAVLVAIEVIALRSATGKVRNKYDPAALNSQSLLAGYINQETGERGYLITGEQNFLAPYATGQATIDRATVRLRTLFAGEPALDDLLRQVSSAGDAWHNAVQPELNARKGGDEAAATGLVLDGTSKTAFDDLRTRLASLQTEVGVRRTRAQDSQSRDAETLVIALIVAAGTATLAVVALVIASRRWVLQPIARLGEALHHVQAGSLDSPLVVEGPAEFQALASDADAMRRRLVGQIEAVSRATEGLAQRAPVVLDIRSALQASGTPDPALDLYGIVATAEGEIAGDWWDIVSVGPGKQVVIIADVSGHGASAGLMATQLKSVILAGLSLNASAPDIFHTAADRIFAGHPDKFATVVVMTIDLGQGTVSWTNAGHPGPLLVSSTGDVRSLGATGPLVHPIAESWTTETAPFEVGDLLLAFSDGLTEARDADADEFGTERLLAAVDNGASAEQTVNEILAVLAEHAPSRRQVDDVTLVAVRRLA